MSRFPGVFLIPVNKFITICLSYWLQSDNVTLEKRF